MVVVLLGVAQIVVVQVVAQDQTPLEVRELLHKAMTAVVTLEAVRETGEMVAVVVQVLLEQVGVAQEMVVLVYQISLQVLL
jgi:hypothetical protein